MSYESMPDITVLMTVYNGMPYLPQAVESVLAQTLRELRFVIVNDGSTDGTPQYLAGLPSERVLVLHQQNQGTAAAANHGLQFCDTEFVARMDADDVMLPGRLEAQHDFLRSHPDVGLVGTQVAPLGSESAGGSLHLPCQHEAIYAALAAGRHGLAHSSIMCRTAVVKQIGGYWPLPLIDDWDFMLRMGEAARLANLPEMLQLYRVHAGSLNGSCMLRVRFGIDYACELARRRRQNLPEIIAAQFEAQQRARPAWQRAAETLKSYALSQYRIALADIYGGRPLRGQARMAWAAACSPGLALQRIVRMRMHDSRKPGGRNCDNSRRLDLHPELTT